MPFNSATPIHYLNVSYYKAAFAI